MCVNRKTRFDLQKFFSHSLSSILVLVLCNAVAEYLSLSWCVFVVDSTNYYSQEWEISFQ